MVAYHRPKQKQTQLHIYYTGCALSSAIFYPRLHSLVLYLFILLCTTTTPTLFIIHQKPHQRYFCFNQRAKLVVVCYTNINNTRERSRNTPTNSEPLSFDPICMWWCVSHGNIHRRRSRHRQICLLYIYCIRYL